MAQLKVKDIIDQRGGAAAVAKALDRPGRPVPKTTVRSWCDADKIPWWRIDAVMALPKIKQDEAA